MKIYVTSAEYKRYNANNRGKNSPDCVKRAISLAFNLSYNEVSKELNELVKNTFRSYKTWPIYEKVIRNHGGDNYSIVSEPIVVSDWIDEFGYNGTYILETGPKPGGQHSGNHLTCVIDGKLYDSWNSSDQYVIGYYVIRGVKREFSDILDHMDELNEEGYKLIYELANKYQDKYNLDGGFRINGGGGKIDSYKIQYNCFYLDAYTGDRYPVSFAVVFTPTTTEEQAEKILKDTIKVRMYDRFYAINKYISDKSEGEKLYRESGYTGEIVEPRMTRQEERFFRSLPGWVRPFVLYISVQNPGMYSDSYRLEIKSIVGDPRKSSQPAVYFYGETANIVKDELKRYRDTFERPDDDYSAYDEYM